MNRHLLFVLSVLGFATLFTGCDSGPYSEPTVDAFTGRVVADGKPVTFQAGDTVRLKLFFHKNGEQFGIPLQSDGTFKIGWMPIGKYTGALEIEKQIKPGTKTPPPTRHQLPDGFEIVEGKTDYEIDLGKGFKA